VWARVLKLKGPFRGCSTWVGMGCVYTVWYIGGGGSGNEADCTPVCIGERGEMREVLLWMVVVDDERGGLTTWIALNQPC
jgi:hypothetical protein